MIEKQKNVPSKKTENHGPVAESGWEPLTNLRDEIDRLFDEFHSSWPFGTLRRQRGKAMKPSQGTSFMWRAEMPAVDMIDKEKEVLLKAELPGLNESEIDVRISDSVLTISGEKKEDHDEGEKEGDYYLAERRYGSFKRSFSLPEGIDRDNVDAKFRKGVLTISLPKTPEAHAKSKKVDVKAEA